jgi:hypothetical protein
MKALLFCGIMYGDPRAYELAISELKKGFGDIDDTSQEYAFDFTPSYLKEFGPNLKKRFVVFKRPIERTELPSIKLATCKLEQELGRDGRRTVNIDPGYITPINVIVASTKDFPHRVYLDRGIFADLQLILKRDEAVSFGHTFPDYEKEKGFFLQQRLKAQR